MNTQHPHPDIDTACQNAATAFAALAQLAPDARASILDAIAAALDARRDEILTTCSEETALTIDELTPEFARTTGTLRMFATLVSDGSWVRAAIDTPSTSPIGPNHDLRSLLTPLGPVAVFGSSNFPLAYGVCGGDTASALAAGCPVIVKEHPSHPRTGRLLHETAHQAIEMRQLPDDPLGYVRNENPKDHSVAQDLVQHEHIAAVGFTGSIPGGLAIERLARGRERPIPVFAEMGSVNPVIITARAIASGGDRIVSEVSASILARFGQQCTCPGIVLVDGYVGHNSPEGEALIERLAKRIDAEPPRDMLAPWVRDAYLSQLKLAMSLPGARLVAGSLDPSGLRGARSSLVVVGEEAWRLGLLGNEIFGPGVIVVTGVFLDYVEELGDFNPPPPSLTISVWCDPDVVEDRRILKMLWPSALSRFGRIIVNGVPTGVRVATSTVHGGPFPATNRPDTTAVGPRAIERWCRPICFQNCPDALLPPELQNANPRNLWRTVNGELSRAGL